MQAEPPPEWVGVRLGPTLAGALYTLLVGSFALVVWARRFPGALPAQLEQAAPWVFLAFVGVFTFYRLGLVRARKYPASKAFFQIGAGLLLFTLMLPGARAPFAPPTDPLELLLHNGNPNFRALAAELAGYRPGGARYGPALVRALQDENPEVREQAHRALVALNGKDLGSPSTPAGLKAWGERYP
jgi:hypothetical protein